MTPRRRRAAQRFAVDASVAVPALDPNHEAHTPCRRAVLEMRPALAGHAAFEAHAVLTRLPPPLRLDAATAAAVLGAAFPETCWPDNDQAEQLRARLGSLGIVGGAVFDALVGTAAASTQRVLLTRDRRAQRTYDTLGIAYRIID